MAEALAELCEKAAPHGRRKYAEKRFGLDAEEARRLIEGRASKAIIDKAFRNGGWGAVLEAFALFFDRGVDQYLAQESHRYAQDAARLSAITRDLRLVGGSGGDDHLGVVFPERRMARTVDRTVGQARHQNTEGEG